MSKIKQLPELDRPREKALRFGIEKLSNIELIAILLGSGSKDQNALELASKLFNDACGLNLLLEKTYQEFTKYKGISKAKGLKLSAIGELAKRYSVCSKQQETQKIDEKYLYHHFYPSLIGQSVEKLFVIVLNKQGKILHEETLFVGIENNVEISIKEILRTVILYKGYSYYLIHNHPNDISEPSSFDVVITEDLSRLSKRMNIILKDHLILVSSGYYSIIKQKFVSI